MTKLWTVILSLVILGCGKVPSITLVVPTATTKPDTTESVPDQALPEVAIPEISLPTPTPTPPQIVSLTVFSASVTSAPIAGWVSKTYTATGHCTQYSGKTYCWDDGMKTLAWQFNNFLYGPFTYSYFEVNRQNGLLTSSYGGMSEDVLVNPTIVNARVLALMAVPPVLTGTSESVDCTIETNGNLTCTGFDIDVNQEEL